MARTTSNRAWIALVIWALTFAVFSGYWLFFVDAIAGREYIPFWLTLGMFANLILFVALRRVHPHPLIIAATFSATQVALVPLFVTILVLRLWPSDSLQYAWLMVGSYFTPLALWLTASVARLARPGLSIPQLLLLYVGLGVLFLFPIPPWPPDSYNSVGALFPYWGLLGPLGWRPGAFTN